MSQEIIFRAWSPKFKKMIYHGIDGFTIDVMANMVWLESIDDETITLMQGLGLKDMDGNMIYVGDILEGFRYRVIWQKGRVESIDKLRIFIEVIFSDGKNGNVGFYLKEIGIHPEDKEKDIPNAYPYIGYALKEARETFLKKNKIVWLGKNNTLKIVGNIFLKEKVLKQWYNGSN